MPSDYYRNKRVLVTGHTGFKGSWLCSVLNELGADVFGYSLEPPTDPSLFEVVDIGETVTSEIGDIRDYDHLSDFVTDARPEVVIHMAAQPLVRESYQDPRGTYGTNVMGTVNILECARQVPSVRSFLNVTTDKVYENLETDRAYLESDPLNGYDPYSNSKSCSELVTQSYRKSFFGDGRCAVSTARAGNVIGGGDFSKDRIIPDCVRTAVSGGKIGIRNPGSVRPYQHVLEPLYAYLVIAEMQTRDAALAGSYNVGPDEEDCVTTGELATLFCRAWDEDLSWECVEDGGPHEAKLLRLDSKLIRERLGVEPRWHIGEAVKRTVEWTKVWASGGDVKGCMQGQINDYFGRE